MKLSLTIGVKNDLQNISAKEYVNDEFIYSLSQNCFALRQKTDCSKHPRTE